MTMPNPARVARSFRRSFASYHSCATEQSRIAEDLAARLHRHGAPERFANAFEIGCGTGHLSHALEARFHFAKLTLNDLMPGAAQIAQSLGAEFLPGDVRVVPWPKAPDLIASASTVQWMEDPGALISRAVAALAPGGWLAVSGFGPDQYAELTALGSTANAPGLCPAQHLAQVAQMAGAEVFEAEESRQTLWFDSTAHVLRHLRETGVNGGAARVWTRRALRAFCEDYETQFGGTKGVPLTYHPVWIIARKPRA
ncbi:MAG: methyltransferase domain-containing protein [Mangrovicoccus sp.]|nr:methyltransferase domain-containing protein [Mangrovicoccus sp.]